jgi:peroxiredoxin
MSSLKPVRDMAGEKPILFPQHLEIEWPSGGRSTWDVTSAIVNPKVTDEDFVMKPPFGYFATIDGQLTPSRLPELVGKDAPELILRWRDGDRKSLADLRGKVVVLYFWAKWCKPCVERMPRIMDLQEKVRKEGVEWISIQDWSNEESDDHVELLEELQKKHWAGRRLSLRAGFDASTEESSPRGATAAKYDIPGWPTTIVVNREGKIASVVENDQIESAIRESLK